MASGKAGAVHAVVLARAFNELGLVWLRLWKRILGHRYIQSDSNDSLDANFA
jgi:hypothetical protein